MTNEEKLLLALCRSYIDGSEPKPCEGFENSIDFKKLFNLARNHNLTGICHCVFNRCKELPVPDGVRKLFEDSFFDLVYLSGQQSDAFSDIKRCLTSSETPFIAFKGAQLRELYPVPESRAMGDIDILIRSGSVNTTGAALEKAGFSVKGFDGTVYKYVKDCVVLEVHTKISGAYDIFGDAFENAVFDGFYGRLDDSFHFAYLIAHTAAHIRTTGAGIRFIIDLSLMLKKGSVSLDRAFEILERADLVLFAKTVISVCSEWFDCGKKYTESTDRLQEYLVNNGVFGSMKDSAHAAASRLIQLQAVANGTDKKKKSSSLSLRLKLAFPSYSVLRGASYIGFLNGRPWLLPAAWIYRFFYNLTKRHGHISQTLKAVDDENAAALANEELDFFEEIGL